MAQRFSTIFGCLAASLGIGCLGASSNEDVVNDVGLTTSALSVCNETVPANRNVDGIPAYAQCADSNSAAIYSNNGVDTSLTQTGSDWVKTQWSGGYQCTEFAHRYLYFKWNIKWLPNGNAGEWCNTQPPANSGVVQTMTPVHGDIMVLAPGSCGADSMVGHVNIIDQVVSDTKLVAVEQNGARRGNYMASCGKCFLHVMANDGTGKPASGAAGAPAAPGGATGVPAAGAAAPGGGFPRTGWPAGAAAPSGKPSGSPDGAAGGGVAATRPTAAASATVTAPVAPASMAPSSSPLVNTSAAAGSGALAPLAGAVTTSPSLSTAKAGCSVAAVGGEHSLGTPVTLTLTLLGGLVLRPRRRSALR